MKTRAIWQACLILLLLCLAPLSRASEPAGEAGQKLFCWKVTGPEGVVYLFGTVHVGKADLYPLPPVIEASFKQADTLITEADLIEPQDTNRLLKILMQKGVYPAGDSVENHIGQQTRALLLPYVAKSKELASDYARLKPWFLTVSIAVIEARRMGFDMSEGLDRHLVDKATEMHKPIGTLETAEFQLELISSFPDELQDRLLLSSLLDAEDKSEGLDRMLRAWKSGDADEMEEAKLRYVREYPSLKPVFEKMFDQRNDGMTRQIEQFLQTPKTYFVAVGAGHLTGERGILSQLRSKNYEVEQLKEKPTRNSALSGHDPG
jgi:uncharacterized protein YbaP (TraB family)